MKSKLQKTTYVCDYCEQDGEPIPSKCYLTIIGDYCHPIVCPLVREAQDEQNWRKLEDINELKLRLKEQE